jgi:hypothetical protein
MLMKKLKLLSVTKPKRVYWVVHVPERFAYLMLLFTLLLVPLLFGTFFIEQQVSPVQAASDERSQWISWASKAWKYFQPGVAVNTNTGLCGASLLWGWPYFTEWDLGTYILAILDAESIGILPSAGSWGSTDRLNKIMTFLQNRELAAGNLSYVWYDARTGNHAWDISNGTTGVSDLGYLLITLHAVKTQRPEYASIIDKVVYERMNISQLASDPIAWRETSGVYEWYVAHGFKFFGFDRYLPVQEALDTLRVILEGPMLMTYNVTLPVTDITSEPLLLAALTLPPEPGMNRLVLKAYLAQENRYHATGKFTGFSEGNTALPVFPSYVYEWIVGGSGETWKITPADITPIIYIKVGFGFYALFRDQYALDLINHVNATFTDFSYGYWDGVDEVGRAANTIIDRTNGIALASARYALENPAWDSLSSYPLPFVSSTGFLNATFIIGDTNPHPPYGWRAYTLDLMGSLGVASKLGQLSSSGYSLGKMDTRISEWNDTVKTVVVDWNKTGTSNVISIGGPPVNMFAYYYEQFGATPFYQTWAGDIPSIHSDLTGKTYAFQWGVDDYALLSVYHNNGRVMIVGWGLTHRGTVAICQVLQYFDSQYAGLLSKRAMIVKWADRNGDTEVDLGDAINIVEAWP